MHHLTCKSVMAKFWFLCECITSVVAGELERWRERQGRQGRQWGVYTNECTL